MRHKSLPISSIDKSQIYAFRFMHHGKIAPDGPHNGASLALRLSHSHQALETFSNSSFHHGHDVKLTGKSTFMKRLSRLCMERDLSLILVFMYRDFEIVQ